MAAASTTRVELRAGLGADTRTLAGRRAAHEAVMAAIAADCRSQVLRFGSQRTGESQSEAYPVADHLTILSQRPDQAPLLWSKKARPPQTEAGNFWYRTVRRPLYKARSLALDTGLNRRGISTHCSSSFQERGQIEELASQPVSETGQA